MEKLSVVSNLQFQEHIWRYFVFITIQTIQLENVIGDKNLGQAERFLKTYQEMFSKSDDV